VLGFWSAPLASDGVSCGVSWNNFGCFRCRALATASRCVFYHVLAGGGRRHLFGDDWFAREANVLRGHRPGIHRLAPLKAPQKASINSPQKTPAQTAPFAAELRAASGVSKPLGGGGSGGGGGGGDDDDTGDHGNGDGSCNDGGECHGGAVWRSFEAQALIEAMTSHGWQHRLRGPAVRAHPFFWTPRVRLGCDIVQSLTVHSRYAVVCRWTSIFLTGMYDHASMCGLLPGAAAF